MANTALNQTGTTSRAYRYWLMTFALSSVAMLAGGLALAGINEGLARPWTGLALAVASGLALVVGASKTSSA